ncbi:hypothetical protein FRC17_000258 [Serendipita sp. 399]|nr:hypothetical protein FRC17_000258 [Serendipita sp. 399]
MSIARTFFNNYIPLLRALEDPFLLRPSFGGLGHVSSRRRRNDDLFFDNFNWALQPSLNLSEENGTYVVEAEVPGVKKENLDVRIGDGGRSLTVSGKVVRRSAAAAVEGQSSTNEAAAKSPAVEEPTEGQVSKIDDSAKQVQLTNDQDWSSTATFSRTVWLPTPIDSSTIKAKLEDGILTIKASSANHESVNVSID